MNESSLKMLPVYECPVPGCTSNSSEEVSWCEFPTEGKRQQEWLRAARVRDTRKICYHHFKPSDFRNEQRQSEAIPSRFPWTEEWLRVQKVDKKEEVVTIANLHDFKDIKSTKNGDYDIVLLLQETIRKSSTNERVDIKKKEVEMAETDVAENLSKLHSAMENIEEFLTMKSFLFTSPLDVIKSHPSLNECFKKPYLFSQTYSISKSKQVSSAEGLEIVKEFHGKPKEKNLPPPGELKRSPLTVSARILVLKTANLLGVWVKATIFLINEIEGQITYRVKCGTSLVHKMYTSKHMAYDKPPDVQIPVGTRVVARYRSEDSLMRPSMYAGIIAEPPKLTNKYRYLVFFDDGYAQYIEHDDICVVCNQSADVSEDIHPGMKDFIKSYLRQYPERPMVKLQKDQFIKTEWNGKWWQARVVEVDGSMVKMFFEADQRVEWIYRGSTRLGLLYKELANAEANRLSGKHRRHNIEQKKPHQPYVEYTRESEVVVLDSDEEDLVEVKKTNRAKRKTGGGQYVEMQKPRNTARKSTTQAKIITNELPNSDVPDTKSHQGYKEMHQLMTFVRRFFNDHICCYDCKNLKTEEIMLQGIDRKLRSPLMVPIFLGYERQVRRLRQNYVLNVKPVVFYRGPCGRHLRSIKDVQKYLTMVGSMIPIDFFSFNVNVFVFRTFKPKVEHYRNDDITEGQENVPVSVVNSLSDEGPPFVKYAAQRFPGKGVTLNLDKEFLCGCDCTDNCLDRARCQCQQLTVRTYCKDGSYPNVGYDHRRLTEPLVTGVYECNSSCSCNSLCMNRVVQNGLQIRLQMFKTQKKGWGIRCLDDVDAGMFICIYAGQLLTEQGADEDGHQFGDEYLAELDHIEVCEKMKEDYESDVPDFDMDMDVENRNEQQGDEDEAKAEVEEDEEAESSGSELNVCADSDSDFESESAPPLRNTAMSNAAYATRSRKSRDSTSSPTLTDTVSELSIDESSSIEPSEQEKKELPDIGPNFSPYKSNPINIRPLSPTSAELIDKIELGRKPKMGKLEDNGFKQITTKKSVSVKHPMSHPSIPPPKKVKYMTIRSFYKEDFCYIMDAKSKGNIGRYLNHSCAPNVFVQNVFVDSHDLRFPTIAFFALNYIDAGTELTWDYNYEVGSVEGKVMYCYCETRKCRGRLL